MKKLVLSIALLAVPQYAVSGGTSWSFKVSAYETVSETSAIIKVIPEDHFLYDCKEATLTLELKPTKTTGLFVSRESQIYSLEKLKASFLSGTAIRLGSMGNGIAHTAGCNFRSKGLAMLDEYNGRRVVYSFHDPI
ncbi:hypothetical protein [Hahella sp. NBU794]|uniref:hypothetical protein n=1 Tax=Hahella sp. NBU794 TaxID=3422590 RepID=UPI003D6E245B